MINKHSAFRFYSNIVLGCALLLNIPIQSMAQFQKEVVAKASSFSITKDEFVKRFEFSPHPRSDKNFDSTLTKREFLLTLVAEKLLAQKALQEGLNKSADYQSAYNYTRNLYLRDALYKIEVEDKVVIADSDLVNGKKKIGKTLFTKFIFSQDKTELDKIYELLKKGASFDSILATRTENKEQKNLEEITFGKMNERIENFLFGLNPGEFTQPLELQEGWYICKVYSISQKSILEETDISKVKRVVSNRIKNRIYEEFYRKYFKGIKVNADTQLFNLLADALTKYLAENKNTLVLKNGKYTLYDKDIMQLRKLIDEKELNVTFVKFSSNPVTLASFLDYMRLEGFDFIKIEKQALRSRMNTYVATYIQNEILAREGLNRGYEKLPVVENDLKLWRENYLSTVMMKKTFKKVNVSDDEAYAFYTKSNKIIQQPDQIRIAEILVSNLDLIKTIYDELDKKTDFATLVNKYSIRDSLSSAKITKEFEPANKEGKIYNAAAGLKVGEVFGPIKTEDGYSIIKLLEKKEGKKEQIDSFEEAKNDIKNILKTEKMFSSMEDITAKLAMNDKVEINQKLLGSIKVNTVNMIVFRRFGFGGQQIAVPYSPNFSKWFKKYEELRKSLPF